MRQVAFATDANIRSYHDFPAISTWLKSCEDDLERGRDKHEYTKLSTVFADNGCTRIDDIARMTPDFIRNLATEKEVNVTVGLVHRVHEYAADDVAHIKGKARMV